MKRASLLILAAIVVVAFGLTFFGNDQPLALALADASASEVVSLEIGSPAPMTDNAMLDVSGEMITLDQIKGENGLLVIFSCNTCPWVKAWEDRYLLMSAKAKEHNIGMVAINSNAAYRERGDGFEDNQARAAELGYDFYYTIDEGAAMADAYGATKTPDVFLFNSDLLLVYKGAIDGNARDPEATENRYLADAMRAMVNGQPVPVETTKSIGCTIKRPR